MKIGIPRALMYYVYYPFWTTFFEKLGCDVIVSGTTSKLIVDRGVKACVDDACLPVKIFHGHVLDLADEVDYIFIPRLVSVCRDEFTCPKFLGLPEMIRSSIKNLPELLILDVNLHRGLQNDSSAYFKLAEKISESRWCITRAIRLARKHQKAFQRSLIEGKNPLGLLRNDTHKRNSQCTKGRIGVIGHPYLVYDSYASMGILDKLVKRGYRVVVPENVAAREIEKACSRFPKKLFWTYGKRILGSGLALLEGRCVDGIIFISSFGCGIDAFIGELLQRIDHREYGIPYTVITLDEHSGEAGFNTRLEAFLDMITWREKNGNYFSAHGQDVHSRQGVI